MSFISDLRYGEPFDQQAYRYRQPSVLAYGHLSRPTAFGHESQIVLCFAAHSYTRGEILTWTTLGRHGLLF
jgi:hypothetical protein